MDDYKKLRRGLQYLRATVNLSLMLEADNAHIVKWWVDALFAVHPDMKSHRGGMMSLGKGTAYQTSTRQKLIRKSSTETELVGVNDVMPQILWTQYFLEAQGYGVEDSLVYQDKQSTILLEENGRASSLSKQMRHIEIRYFFVTDRIITGEVKVEYCPTGKMLEDFFTKPLQGVLFKKFCDHVLNLNGNPTYKHCQDRRSVLRKQETRMTQNNHVPQNKVSYSHLIEKPFRQ
jgi:hypothetical protein